MVPFLERETGIAWEREGTRVSGMRSVDTVPEGEMKLRSMEWEWERLKKIGIKDSYIYRSKKEN
jgi:hypothetical protein